MVHLLTFANLLIQFRHTKNNASSFSQCFYNWRCVICTVNWVFVQIQNVVQWWTHDNCSMQIYVLNLYKQWATYLVKCISVAYNLTILLPRFFDKMCVSLLISARDDDRYVTVFKLNETTTGMCLFLQLDETARNNRKTSFQTLSAKWKCSVKRDTNKILLS